MPFCKSNHWEITLNGKWNVNGIILPINYLSIPSWTNPAMMKFDWAKWIYREGQMRRINSRIDGCRAIRWELKPKIYFFIIFDIWIEELTVYPTKWCVWLSQMRVSLYPVANWVVEKRIQRSKNANENWALSKLQQIVEIEETELGEHCWPMLHSMNLIFEYCKIMLRHLSGQNLLCQFTNGNWRICSICWANAWIWAGESSRNCEFALGKVCNIWFGSK